MKIALYAHNGSNNHGCEALVRTICMLFNGADITLYSANPAVDIRYGIDSIVKVEIEGKKPGKADILMNKVLKFLTDNNDYNYRIKAKNIIEDDRDVYLSIGGDNYCYDGYEKYLIYLNKTLKKKGKKTVLWGCSVAPKVLENKEILEDMMRYDLIVARESITYNALLNNGIQNMRLLPDSAFLLEKEKCLLPENFEEGNTVAINISSLYEENFAGNKEKARKSINLLIEHIIENTGYKILFVPHVISDVGTDDYNYMYSFYAKYRDTGRVVIPENYKELNCMNIKYLISKCKLLVAARTHASIAGYSEYVPTLVLGYSIKSKGIAEDLFGTYQNYVLPAQEGVSEHELTNHFIWLDTNKEKIANYLRERIPVYVSILKETDAKELVRSACGL